MQQLDTLGTLHYRLRRKRCRSARHFRTWIPLASRGARPEHVQSRRRGASWEPVGASWRPLGSFFGFFWTFWGPLPPPSFSYSLPIIPSSAGSNHGRRRDQLPPGWRCAAVRPGGKNNITLQSLCGLWGASLGPFGGFLGTSRRSPGGFLGPSGGLLGASWGLLKAS